MRSIFSNINVSRQQTGVSKNGAFVVFQELDRRRTFVQVIPTMKKTTIFSALLVAFLMGLAQQATAQNNVQFKVTRDDPNDICNLWVYLDPFQMDAPIQNIDGLSFNLGVQAIGFVGNRFGFDYATRFGLLTLGKLGNKDAKRSFQLEAGGMFVLGNRVRTKQKTKVVLDQTETTNMSGDRVTTTKFIMIPAKQGIRVFARGGLYLKKNPYVHRLDETGVKYEGNLTAAGLYLGLGRMAISNVYINTNTDGKALRSGAWRLYADALICPVRKLEVFPNTTPIPTDYKFIGGPIGFRLGIWGMGVESRDIQKRKAFSAGVEVGIRPGDGLYGAGSIMFPIVRRKSAALGYKAPAQNPSQQTEKE
ncbi:MAG: hypothetical protein ACRCYO_01950 [Bacteroidia bacterium]